MDVTFKHLFPKSTAKTYASFLKDIDLQVAFREPHLVVEMLNEKKMSSEAIANVFKALRAVAKALIKDGKLKEEHVHAGVLKGSYTKNIINKVDDHIELEHIAPTGDEKEKEKEEVLDDDSNSDILTILSSVDSDYNQDNEDNEDKKQLDYYRNEHKFLKSLLNYTLKYLPEEPSRHVGSLLLNRLYENTHV